MCVCVCVVRASHVNPNKYEIDDYGQADGEVEVTYSGSAKEDELMWV